MKDYRYLITRAATLSVLLAATTGLTGCETIGGAAGSVYDAITWGPRKLWSVTFGEYMDVKNEQETEMGARRRPAGNPDGRGAMPDFAQPTPQNPNTLNKIPSASAMPGGSDDMNGYPDMPPMGGGASPYGNPAGAMPPMPQQMPGGGSYPTVNPYSKQGRMPPMPQGMPPMGGDMGSPYSSGMPPMQGAPGGDPMGGMDADAAYSSYGRNMGGGGGEEKKGWFSWWPFSSSKYKMDEKFELMSAEFVIAQSDMQAIDTDPSMAQPASKPKKSGRSASMFPLEEYAPKPTVKIEQTSDAAGQGGSYPKLGDVPALEKNGNDVKAASTELEKMLNESKAVQNKQAAIHSPESEEMQKVRTEHLNTYKLATQPEKTVASSKKYGSLSAGVSKNDEDIIQSIPENGNVLEEPKDKKKPGFFSRLFGSSEPEKPGKKMITRKSEPPVTTPKRLTTSENKGAKKPSIDEVKEMTGWQPPLPNVEVDGAKEADSVKNYEPASGSFLPKPRYTDRRKVPQTD